MLLNRDSMSINLIRIALQHSITDYKGELKLTHNEWTTNEIGFPLPHSWIYCCRHIPGSSLYRR